MYEQQKATLRQVERLVNGYMMGEREFLVTLAENGPECVDISTSDGRDRFLTIAVAYLAETRDIALQLDREVDHLSHELASAEVISEEMTNIIARKEEFFPNFNDDPPF